MFIFDIVVGLYFSFMEKFNLPGTIGVVDGTLITIVTPPIHDDLHPAHLFIDRKGHHSINAQIVSRYVKL